MSGKNIIINNKKINKTNFYKNRKLIQIDNVDVNKILVSKGESFDTKNSFKYFIGYNDNDNIRPLCVMLPRMIGYAKYFDSNKAWSFKVSDKKLLKKYIEIRGKISSLINEEFDSEPVYGYSDKYIKTKIKLYGDKTNINFQGKKISKENTSYKCLSLIMLNSLIIPKYFWKNVNLK